MSIRAYRTALLGSCACLLLIGLSDLAGAQTAPTKLPEVVVSGVKPKPKPRRVHVAAPAPAAPVTPAAQLNAKADAFDQSRSNLYTTIGTTSATITQSTIQALPGGDNQPVEKILLQAPGVSQDSAASGLLHVRNDHANVQFRINGVMLPDGLTGFGSILDASWIGSIALVVGALPAEYGLRTVGLVDITTRPDIFNNSGQVSLYGGSQGTFTPTIQYGGTFGSTCPTTALRLREPARCPVRIAFPASSTSSSGVTCKPRKASKIRSPRTARSTTSRNRKKASPICRRSSTPIRGSA